MSPMKWEDLIVALQFYFQVPEGIVVQVPSAGDIGYVKRVIINQLGAPSKVINNTIWYGTQPIDIISIQSEVTMSLIDSSSKMKFFIDYDESNPHPWVTVNVYKSVESTRRSPESHLDMMKQHCGLTEWDLQHYLES